MDILGALGQLYMKVLLLLLFAGSGLAVWALIKSFQNKGNNKVQSKASVKDNESNKNILNNIKFDKKLGGIIMNGNGWFKLAIFSLAGIVISAVLLGFVSTNSGTGMNMNGMNGMNSNQQSNMNMNNSNMGNNSMQNGMNGNMNSGNSNMQSGMTNNNMNNSNMGNSSMQGGMSMNGQASMNGTNNNTSVQQQLNNIQNQLNQLQSQMQQQSQMNNTQNQNSNMSNGSSGSSSGSMSSGGGMSMM